MTNLGPATIFVPGKPLTDIWAPPGLEWQRKLRSAAAGPLRNPYLRFVRNDRNHFDVDNLAYPVLAVAGCAACESVWVSVERGGAEGVWIKEQPPPPPPAEAMSVRIEKPNTSSVPGREPPPEITEASVVAPGMLLGLSLEFDSDKVQVGELSFEGPTKSLIDDLGPLLGFRPYMGRTVSDDERVKELRITRGHFPGRTGVRIVIWPLDAGQHRRP
ncbi:MAG: hypothetical protein M0Z30_11210 [Actinomycetota bacterium]|nr:hypothetical protein [Actinomycetota bacterium]